MGSANLITKVYFPRLVIPLSGVVGGLVDFAVASLVLAGLMVWCPPPNIVKGLFAVKEEQNTDEHICTRMENGTWNGADERGSECGENGTRMNTDEEWEADRRR